MKTEYLGGRYKIVDFLGAGGMGSVYTSHFEDRPDQLVALKVLHKEFADDESAVKRFREEVIATQTISHLNIVSPIEMFRDENDVAFSMEYLPGGDLATHLEQNGSISIPQSITFMKDIASALYTIHKAGIVHRDIKPENILLTDNYQTGELTAKVSDFGIAHLDYLTRERTGTGVFGTVVYLCPEYIKNEISDPRGDIYALGVIGYEMITGMQPFYSESVIETLKLKFAGTVSPIHALRPECPDELARIIYKMLEIKSARRYQRIEDVIYDLGDLTNPKVHALAA